MRKVETKEGAIESHPEAKDNQAKAISLAQDLKSKGYTLDDIRKAGALETELVSDKPTTEAGNSTLSRFNPEAVKSLETAFEDLEMKEGEENAVRGGSNVFPSEDVFAFESEEEELEAFAFDDVEEIPFQPMLAKHSSKEQAVMASAKTGEPVEVIQDQMKNGDYSMVSQASNAFGEEFYTDMFSLYEKNIQEANEPKEIAILLQDLERQLQRKPTLAEQRAAYVQNVTKGVGGRGGGDIESLHPILRESVKNNLISNDISKMQNEYANTITPLKMAGDFLEVFFLVGAASEEGLKYASDIYNNLDRLEDLPFEKQMALIESMVEGAKNQETYLFNNNNSLIAGGQIDTIYNAVLQGARLKAEGATEAEVTAMLETGFNGTLFIGESVQLAKSLGNMGKWLMRRMHSRKHLAEAFTEQEELMEAVIRSETVNRLNPDNAQYRMEGTTPKVEIVEGTTDSRDALEKAASAKGSRKERKALETEKKDLSKSLGKLESEDLNKKARQVSREKKIKFKEALKEVREENLAARDVVKKRQGTNQELITDFDKAAKAESDLSRTKTLIDDGRMTVSDVLTPTGEFSVTSIQSPTINPTGLRPDSGLFDTLYRFSPSVYETLRAEKGFKGLVEETGLDAEAVAERLIPTPNAETEQGFTNISEEKMLSDLIFVDANKHSIGQGLGRELEKPMGTSLTPDYSSTGFVANDIEGSYGTFTFLLADGAKGGFTTRAGAEDAIESAAVGYDFKVVQKENGFFVEVEIDHYSNPYSDVAGLEIKGKTPSNAISWALNRYRNIEEDLLRGLAAMKNVNRSTLQKMEGKAKNAVKDLSSLENKLLMEILENGDNKGKEWNSIQKLNKDMGIKTPDNVWKAYTDIRSIYDDIYVIRERNYYNKLRAGNQKYIDFKDNGDLGIGKAIQIKDIEVDVVYDTILGKVVNKKDLPTDSIVVKLGKEKEFNGKSYTHVRVTPEQIKKLTPNRTLNKRKGHIDRMYRDAGWVVLSPFQKEIDGVIKIIMKPTHIVKTEAQAKKLTKGIKAITTTEVVSKADGTSSKTVTETGPSYQASRETQQLESDIYGDSESVQFGYGASHLKQRGEKVKGSDGVGAADTLNVFESLFKSIGSVGSALDYNAYQSLLVKFTKGFSEYLKGGANAKFLPSWEEMVSEEGMKALIKNPDMRTELINHHAYLKSLQDNDVSKLYKAIDKILTPILAPILSNPSTKSAAMKMQALTSELYIVWNGIYQAEQNLMPVLFNLGMAVAPRKGWSTHAGAIAQLPAILYAFKTDNFAPLAKLLGSESLAKELVDSMRTNGLIDAIGRSNDFLDLARKEGASVATTGFQAAKKAGSKIYKAPRALSLGLQESSIVLHNALSYLIEFNELRAAGRAFDAKGKADISFQAQKRTQSQTSLDRFAYQEQGSPVALAGQFMQAVHKFFLDVVIEPQWEVIRAPINKVMSPVTDKYLGQMGKNKGKFAETWNKAFLTTLITYGAFGLEGGLGKSMGSSFEDMIRSQYEPEEIPAVLDAFLDGGMNASINAMIEDSSVDVNATMSPSAFVDMVTSLVFEDFPKVNMVGASAFSVGGVLESVVSSGAIIYESVATEEIEWTDALSATFLEAMENFKILNTAMKSYISYWTGRNASARSLSGQLPITQTESILLNLGIQPEMHADYYHRNIFNSGFSLSFKDSKAKSITDANLQAYAREAIAETTSNAIYNMVTGEGDPELGLIKQNEIRDKWLKVTKEMNDPKYEKDIERAFINRGLKFGSEGYDVYMKPYLDAAAENNKTKYLKLLEQKATEGDMKEEIKHIREGYEIMEGK